MWKLRYTEVGLLGSHGVFELECVGVVKCDSCICGSCVVKELLYVEVALCKNHGVWELQCVGLKMFGNCDVKALRCLGVAIYESCALGVVGFSRYCV